MDISKTLHVLHVASSVSREQGGVSKAVLEMAQAQANFTKNVTLFTAYTDHPAVPLQQLKQSEVDLRMHPPVGPTRLSYLAHLRGNLRQQLPKTDICVLHGSYQYPCYVASQLCYRYGVPYIFIPHGSLDPEVRKKHRTRNRLIDLSYHDNVISRASTVQFTSDRERLRCERKCYSSSVVFPLGLDFETAPLLKRTNAFRKKHNIPLNAKVFLFISRITRKKRLDILSAAFNLILQRHADAFLFICGPIDADMQRQMKTAVASGGGKILVTGPLYDREKYSAIGDADIFILPTYSENFGYAAFEAIAHGIPLITTTGLDWHAELAKLSTTLICSPTVEGLTMAIEQSLEDYSHLREGVLASRAELYKNFSWDAVAKKMLDYYRFACEKHTNTYKRRVKSRLAT